MNSSTGIATSDSYLAVPRDPSSSDTLAMVCSSGASTMFTKSKRPRVAHCALTVAPSCSTSLFTSRMRVGLFFTVWTPSGVSVLSSTKVGMTFLSPLTACSRVSRSFSPRMQGRRNPHEWRVTVPLSGGHPYGDSSSRGGPRREPGGGRARGCGDHRLERRLLPRERHDHRQRNRVHPRRARELRVRRRDAGHRQC